MSGAACAKQILCAANLNGGEVSDTEQGYRNVLASFGYAKLADPDDPKWVRLIEILENPGWGREELAFVTAYTKEQAGM